MKTLYQLHSFSLKLITIHYHHDKLRCEMVVITRYPRRRQCGLSVAQLAGTQAAMMGHNESCAYNMTVGDAILGM